MLNIRLKFTKKDALVKIPEYKTEGAACCDLYARLEDDQYIHDGETQAIGTGLFVEVPKGYELQIRARSGLASRGIMLSNGVGCVDSDYRGEVKVLLTNTTKYTVLIENFDRVAQCCLQPVTKIYWDEVDCLSDTVRGDGGFGSTGVK